MKLILFLLVILITGCQWQKEFSKTEKAKTEEKKDVETKVSEEKTLKTNDSTYEKRIFEIFGKIKTGDTVINNVTTPVYNYYPQARYIEEKGNVSKTEDTNKKDTSNKDNSVTKSETITDENKSSKGSFMSMGWLIGLGFVLLVIGYLFSKLKISLK
jgi:hypothetical protein